MTTPFAIFAAVVCVTAIRVEGIFLAFEEICSPLTLDSKRYRATVSLRMGAIAPFPK